MKNIFKKLALVSVLWVMPVQAVTVSEELLQTLKVIQEYVRQTQTFELQFLPGLQINVEVAPEFMQAVIEEAIQALVLCVAHIPAAEFARLAQHLEDVWYLFNRDEDMKISQKNQLFRGMPYAGVNIHGNLVGLLRDDHPQYLKKRGDAMSGDLDMAGNQILNAVLDLKEHDARFALAEHSHQHGNQVGGNLHELVTAEQAGFMASTDKQTLDMLQLTALRTPVLSGIAGQFLATDGAGSVFWADGAAVNTVVAAPVPVVSPVVNNAVSATAQNIPQAIVARDMFGNFGASTVTANLTGNVTGNLIGVATTATNFIAPLVGDVVGTQNATSVSFVGGQPASAVAAATAIVLAAAKYESNTVDLSNNSAYAFAYDTTTQTVLSAHDFKNSTFTVQGAMSGWSYLVDTAQFVCGKSGVYLIHYDAVVDKTSTGGAATSLIAALNGVEIPGSQAVVNLAARRAETVSKMCMVQAHEGDMITFCFAGDSTAHRLLAGEGSGVIRPSITIAIIKL